MEGAGEQNVSARPRRGELWIALLLFIAVLAPAPVTLAQSAASGTVAAKSAVEPARGSVSATHDAIRPVYPWRARKLRQEGRVLVQVSYDTLGRLVDLQLARSSGFRLLDREALRAVRLAEPRSSQPVEEIEVVFELEDSEFD